MACISAFNMLIQSMGALSNGFRNSTLYLRIVFNNQYSMAMKILYRSDISNGNA